MRPYIAIDLETTGLPVDKVEILELGFVYDDGVSAIEDLEKHNFVMQLSYFGYSEPFAMDLNARLIKLIKEGKGVPPGDAFETFMTILAKASKAAQEHDVAKGWKKPNKRVDLAGKNAAGFDIPIIKNFLPRWVGNGQIWVDRIFDLVSHRTLDPGSMYAADFGYIPSLGEINKLIGSSEVTHQALDDALDVVKAVRWKEKKNG